MASTSKACLLLIGCVIANPANAAFGGDNNRVLLRDLNVLTLQHGQKTNSRRSSPIPQLNCVGGSAGCSFKPQVVQCYNRGFDGYDVQWECKTDMDNAYRFGRVEVSCEGYEYSDDSYILRGSCGLEYTLDLTKEGQQQQQGGQQQHDYYGGHSQHSGHHHQRKSSDFGSIIILGIVAVIAYAIYKTCIAQPAGTAPYPPGDNRSDAHRSGAPPPPGFRNEYTQPPPGGGCSSSYDSTYTSGGYTGGATRTSGGGGFWTGAATGGLLGYLMGNRGGNSGWGSGRQRTGWGGNSWGGNSWGSSGGDSWGGSGGATYSSGGGGGSSGTRTASGFGGTKRR